MRTVWSALRGAAALTELKVDLEDRSLACAYKTGQVQTTRCELVKARSTVPPVANIPA